MTSSSPSVGNAVAKAAGAWAAMYLVFGFILAFWKWSSGAPFDARYEANQLQLQEQEAKGGGDTMKLDAESILSLTHTFPSKQLRHSSWIEDMQQLLPGLNDLEQHMNDHFRIPKPWERGIKKPSIKDLETLLKVQDLSSLSDKEFTDLMRRTKLSVGKNIKLNHTLQWEPVVDLFRTKFPKRTPHSVKDFQCPSAVAGSSSTSSEASSEDLQKQVYEQYAMNEHLSSAANAVIELVQGRRIPGKAIHQVLMPEAKGSLEKQMWEGIGTLLESVMPEIQALVEQYEAVSAAADKDDDDAASEESASSKQQQCASEEQILELIEVGLTSIYRQDDLRRALTNTVRQMDPSVAQELILDADLPLAAPTPPEPSDTVNLAHVIDTPALQALKGVIDKVVDVSGGYSETLDRYLDSVVGHKNDEGVGHMAVSSLLQKASKINLPHPQKIVQKLPPALQRKLSSK